VEELDIPPATTLAMIMAHLVPHRQASVDVLDTGGVETLPMRLVLGERDAVVRFEPRAPGDVPPQHPAVVEWNGVVSQIHDTVALAGIPAHRGHRRDRPPAVRVVVDVL